MVNSDLDAVFGALSSPVRRDVVSRLRAGPATVGQLAAPLTISLPALSRHLSVLEAAGLLTRTKQGRTTRCSLPPDALDHADRWLARHRRMWTDGLDRLATQVDEKP